MIELIQYCTKDVPSFFASLLMILVIGMSLCWVIGACASVVRSAKGDDQ